jgi:ABC-2 family transporter protein
MTALTMPARPAPDPDLRPVPWQRMAWVTWRQHRIALGGVTVLLGAWALFLWHTGLQMHRAYAAAIACRPANSLFCGHMLESIPQIWGSSAAVNMVQAAPPLIGAFVGAPLLARDLETGTFRYVWTQGLGRRRWTLAKLVPLAIVLAALAAACGMLFSWYYQPFFVQGWQTPLSPQVFDVRGVAFPAWTLAAFAIGALAGMLIRRVLPAMAATLAVYTGLAFVAALFLRQRYMTPLATRNPNLPGTAWIIGQQWHTRSGQPVSASAIDQILLRAPQVTTPGGGSKTLDPVPYLMRHGYTLWTNYQPASRFWPFQWIEGGWLLALSVLLFAATVWLVRRRAT